MADAVTVRKSGMAEMAYVGETPWHGLGQKLKDGASVDVWKKQAGMDWMIERSPMMFMADGKPMAIDGRSVLYRNDEEAYIPLGEVSENYQIVQPGEVMEFFRGLTEGAGMQLNTAGTLFGGKRFWGLAKVGETTEIVKGDAVESYLLLASSSDGSLATTAQFTSVRVVCNNTLSMSLRGSKKMVRVSHRSQFDPELAKQELGLVHDAFKEFSDAAKTLSKKKVAEDIAEQFVINLLNDFRVIASKEPAEAKAVRAIMDLYQGEGKGAELRGVAGTGWGLVNAVTEFVDHHAKAKTDAHRLSNAWFGRGDQLKTAALDRMLEMA